MNLIDEIIYFGSSLSINDYVFFFAVVVLLILVISLIYLIKNEEGNNKPINELEQITKKIEEEYKPVKIEFSEFEKEQEKEAIISYEELLENSKKYELNYDEEKNVDGLSIKKVDSEEMFVESEEEFELEIKKFN